MMHPIIAEDIRRITDEIGGMAGVLSGKTLLLTGGAGFLGQYVVRTLRHLNATVLERPCKVVVLDNFITGLPQSLEKTDDVEVVQHDVTTPYQYDGPVHFIIHAAGVASPVFYRRFPLQALDVGTLGTRAMLELARDKGVESFLLMSSSEIYGDPDSSWVPTPESYLGNVSCVGPRACYDEGKRVSETYAVNYHQVHGVPTKIVRPFNIYGPGMRLDDWRVIPNFTVAALRGEKIPVYGDGSHTRSFCYVSDGIVGMFRVLFSKYDAEAFNVGNDTNEITMQGLADVIADLFGDAHTGRIVAPNDAYGKADPKRRCPDLNKIHTFVGFSPSVDLVTGLGRFIAWAKDQEVPDIPPKAV